MKKRRRISTFLLAAVLLLSGCGKESGTPILIEPVVNNQSYRPVERGVVGRTEVKIADVVPEEYCHFTKNATEILEIKVDLGQYVEQGEVLAIIDVAEFEDEIENKNAEIKLRNGVLGLQDKIYREQIKELKRERKICIQQGDTEGQKQCEMELAIAEENKRYDEMLCKHQVTMLQEEIQELRESVENGTIKARHAGYVTYVKDLSGTSDVESMENIVIVSDYSCPHLELADDLSSGFYSKDMQLLNRVYIRLGGKEYAVEPHEYTNDELLAMQRSHSYPRIRLELKSESGNIQPGEKIPVYFVSGKKENVLKIGQDSLYTEGDKYFVYVKKGEEKEKREVQLGETTETEAEIVSGLEEGEWVFYSSSAIMPNVYEEYVVKKDVFSPQGGEVGLRSQYAYTKLYTYTQQENATVESLNFSAGDRVNKGDLICVLATDASAVRLKEIENSISNLRTDYEKNKKDYDKQIKMLKKEIAQKKKQLSVKKQDAADEKAGNEGAEMAEAFVKENTQKMEAEITAPESDNSDTQKENTSGENTGGEMQEAAPEEKNDGAVQEEKSDGGKTEDQAAEEAAEGESSTGETADELAQLEYQQNIMVYQRDILTVQYQYDYGILQKEYDQAAKKNNGHGKKEIYAAQSGVLGNINIYQGMQIKPDEDNCLFQIFDEDSRKLIIDTREDFVGAGNKASFALTGEESKTYTGQVVGNSAVAGKIYLSQVNDKIYVTKSIADQERNRAYIVVEESAFHDMDEETFYSKVQSQEVETSYSKIRLQDVVVLPRHMVNEEVNKWQPNVTYYYVWKIVDGILVKQYVKTDEALNTIADTCILEGLKDGDVVAGQSVNEE